jgi:hypothetical protein
LPNFLFNLEFINSMRDFIGKHHVCLQCILNKFTSFLLPSKTLFGGFLHAVSMSLSLSLSISLSDAIHPHTLSISPPHQLRPPAMSLLYLSPLPLLMLFLSFQT